MRLAGKQRPVDTSVIDLSSVPSSTPAALPVAAPTPMTAADISPSDFDDYRLALLDLRRVYATCVLNALTVEGSVEDDGLASVRVVITGPTRTCVYVFLFLYY